MTGLADVAAFYLRLAILSLPSRLLPCPEDFRLNWTTDTEALRAPPLRTRKSREKSGCRLLRRGQQPPFVDSLSLVMAKPSSRISTSSSSRAAFIGVPVGGP